MQSLVNFASGPFPTLKARNSLKTGWMMLIRQKGEAEDKASAADEEIAEKEEEAEEDSEEESHAHRD